MILLVFEGQVGEPRVMATLQYLYFSDTASQVLCYFGTDTYTLWKDIKEHEKDGYEADIFTIVKQRLQENGDHSLDKYKSYQFESVYLFFDYDPQNTTISMARLNSSIENMLRVFDDPMNKGKLFISYPMLECLFCLNSLSDSGFPGACVKLDDCSSFKEWCISHYEWARKPLTLLYKYKRGRIDDPNPESRKQELRYNWNQLVLMSASKANMICSGSYVMPSDTDDISQEMIFRHQIDDYVIPSSRVSILSAFTMFLFDYFHGNGEI